MLKNWWPYAIVAIILVAILIAKFVFWPLLFLAAILAILLCFLFFEKALMLFAFTLPLEKTLSIDIGGFTFRFSHFLIGALAVAWLVKSLLNKKLKIFWNQSLVFLILYLVVAAISLRDVGNLGRGWEVFIFTTFAIFSFWFLCQLFREQPKRIILFLKTLFISAIAVGIFGLLQISGDLLNLPIWLTGIGEGYTKGVLGFPRVRASFFEPLYFGSFIILILPLVYMQINSVKKLISQKWLKILLLLLLINLILTFARSAYLAFAVEVLIVAIFSIKFIFQKKALRFLSAFTLIFVLFLFVFLNFPKIFPHKVQAALKHTVETTDWSSFERLNSGGLALDLFRENPIKGIGLGQFGPYFANFPSEAPETGWQTVNNESLELLAETGILGFVPILLFYIYLIFNQILAIKRSKNEFAQKLNIGFLVALIGIAVQWQFFSTLYVIYIFAFFALALSFAQISIKENFDSLFPLRVIPVPPVIPAKAGIHAHDKLRQECSPSLRAKRGPDEVEDPRSLRDRDNLNE